VTSQKVGILHLLDPKTGEPFVVEKDKVTKTKKVGYITALGQNFTVKSGVAGTVTSILVRDGQAVEFGQPIIEIGD
jgi:acetyl-CoA carboxylase biotin carboxyl carrier protein